MIMQNQNMVNMVSDSFIVLIKTNDIYKDIAKHVEIGLHTLIFEFNRPLSKGKNEKLIQLMKDGLAGLIIK